MHCSLFICKQHAWSLGSDTSWDTEFPLCVLAFFFSAYACTNTAWMVLSFAHLPLHGSSMAWQQGTDITGFLVLWFYGMAACLPACLCHGSQTAWHACCVCSTCCAAPVLHMLHGSLHTRLLPASPICTLFSLSCFLFFPSPLPFPGSFSLSIKLLPACLPVSPHGRFKERT